MTVFRPGETIEVRWLEDINHDSYFRIAFEQDGDDFVQRPPEALSAAGDDPLAGEAALDVGQLLAVIEDTSNGGEHSATVTLPDVECDHCTLQLVQFMYGRADSYYYPCADITLRGEGASGAGGSENTAGSAGAWSSAGALGTPTPDGTQSGGGMHGAGRADAGAQAVTVGSDLDASAGSQQPAAPPGSPAARNGGSCTSAGGPPSKSHFFLAWVLAVGWAGRRRRPVARERAARSLVCPRAGS